MVVSVVESQCVSFGVGLNVVHDVTMYQRLFADWQRGPMLLLRRIMIRNGADETVAYTVSGEGHA